MTPRETPRHFLIAALLIRGQLLGVTTCTFSVRGRRAQERRAQTFDLLFDGGPHVEARDDTAEPAGGPAEISAQRM